MLPDNSAIEDVADLHSEYFFHQLFRTLLFECFSGRYVHLTAYFPFFWLAVLYLFAYQTHLLLIVEDNIVVLRDIVGIYLR